MVFRLPILLLAGLAVVSCTPYERDAARDVSRAPAAQVVGEPVNCIPLHQARESRVRDDFTIDFMRNGREGWRNTLPNRCSGLALQNAFTYKTSQSELCSVDIIYVLETAGGLHRGTGCGLGRFVPIVLER